MPAPLHTIDSKCFEYPIIQNMEIAINMMELLETASPHAILKSS